MEKESRIPQDQFEFVKRLEQYPGVSKVEILHEKDGWTTLLEIEGQAHFDHIMQAEGLRSPLPGEDVSVDLNAPVVYSSDSNNEPCPLSLRLPT